MNIEIASAGTSEQGMHRPALDYALGMVSQLGQAGLTAVPVKPTLAMLTAGARAGGVSVETTWKIFQAMVAEEG